MESQGPTMESEKPKVGSEEPAMLTTPRVAPHQPFKYSNRVLLKTILERDDGGLGLVGVRVRIGGWVKSSKEVKKEPVVVAPPQEPPADDGSRASPPGPVDVSCVEMLQTRIPLFRSIIKILGGGGSGAPHRQRSRDKLEPVVPRPPLPPPPPPPLSLPVSSVVYLVVSDGSCIKTIQVMVESSIAPPSQLLPTGTCILVEGVLQQPPQPGKHGIEIQAEKVLHVGVVEQDKYPLSKKRLPLEMLRDYSHFRPRTTTVATVMRIRNVLTFGTHTFFQNHGFLSVQVPIITTIDTEGFSEKFQVTTLFDTAGKKVEPSSTKDAQGVVTLDVVKAAIKEKSELVEKLKRSESNREALIAALQDLQKTNQLASQLEAKEKLKTKIPESTDNLNFAEDFFSLRTYLTTSGLLHLESYACALGNVYSFGPTFRANRATATKQMAEMWMVEAEMAFSQLEDAMNCAEDLFKFLCKCVLENCSEDMKFVSKRIDKTIVDRLSLMTLSSYERISYEEAVDILQKATERTPDVKFDRSIPLTAEQLSYLADEIYKKPVIVYNFPKELKPFYGRLNDDGKTVAAFDMVVPKVGRVITGSQNEERVDMLDARIEELGLPREQYEWYLDLRRHGTVIHSGFSLGFDLMVLFTTGLVDVRDAVPFARSFGKAYN